MSHEPTNTRTCATCAVCSVIPVRLGEDFWCAYHVSEAARALVEDPDGWNDFWCAYHVSEHGRVKGLVSPTFGCIQWEPSAAGARADGD